MIIGIPKETIPNEYRVSMLPVGVDLLVQDGHQVLLERGAGAGSGYVDDEYVQAGASLVDEPVAMFERAELIVKVKEPMGDELVMLRRGQTVFTYFHFAVSRSLTEQCLAAKITALAYETLTDDRRELPLLNPMSEVAGRMSIQEGAKYLEKPMMGRGDPAGRRDRSGTGERADTRRGRRGHERRPDGGGPRVERRDHGHQSRPVAAHRRGHAAERPHRILPSPCHP